jgi:hypothetical protein
MSNWFLIAEFSFAAKLERGGGLACSWCVGSSTASRRCTVDEPGISALGGKWDGGDGACRSKDERVSDTSASWTMEGPPASASMRADKTAGSVPLLGKSNNKSWRADCLVHALRWSRSDGPIRGAKSSDPDDSSSLSTACLFSNSVIIPRPGGNIARSSVIKQGSENGRENSQRGRASALRIWRLERMHLEPSDASSMKAIPQPKSRDAMSRSGRAVHACGLTRHHDCGHVDVSRGAKG